MSEHNSMLNKPNIVLIISDQQSWRQNWDENWAKENLPAMQRLLQNGIAFNRAHCNSCTCSPSRTTLFTGVYPAHHRVTQVLECDDDSSTTQTSQQVLSNNFQNMAKMLSSAGYHIEYKGKWHITKPTRHVTDNQQFNELYWTEADVAHIANLYGFNGWTFPDAGENMELYTFGGGDINNDGRFVDGNGQSGWYGKGDEKAQKAREAASALRFIQTYKETHGAKPFFLVVSLVNPHDVLSYPKSYKDAGYKDEDFSHIKVTLPETINESFDTKPTVHKKWKEVCQLNGPIESDEKAEKYLQFYAHLSSVVDNEINKVLNALDSEGFTDNTLIIRTSDHGDMQMAHNKQRQKMYNVYQQTLNIPLIFSNPVAFKNPQTTEAMAGLIDLMPTLAKIAGVPNPEKWMFQGKDLTPILQNPEAEVQDYIHFTYDDDYFGTQSPANMGPSHIRCIVEKEWKYAVYFDPHYGWEPQYEIYNMATDPNETRNLAHPEYSEYLPEGKQQELHDRLIAVMQEKGTMPDAIIWPKIPGKGLPPTVSV